MIRKEIIKEILSDFQSRKFREIIPRDYTVPIGTGKIITLSGVRRSGKTFLLLDTIIRLTSLGVDIKDIIYLNFEDERLLFSIEELDLILQAYREMFPGKELENCYFFFDEIQNINGWEKFVRRVYDSISKNVFITGSNSSMLADDIATSLRGRTIKIEVFPLSFKEYLRFSNIDPNSLTSENKARISGAFSNYLENGGFPETVAMEQGLRTATLQEYYNVLLFKDLVERYNISNTTFFKYFLGRVVANLTKPTSVNKIYNELKSLSYKTTKNILYDILDWTLAVYFNIKTEKFNLSLLKRELSAKKYYFIDNGLLNSITFKFSDDRGKLLENVMALYLHKEFGGNIFYFKEQKECDFVAFVKDKPELIIQVSYDISNLDTLKRELNGAIAACKYFGSKSAFLLTNDTENLFNIDNISIHAIPAYKFLLSKD